MPDVAPEAASLRIFCAGVGIANHHHLFALNQATVRSAMTAGHDIVGALVIEGGFQTAGATGILKPVPAISTPGGQPAVRPGGCISEDA